MQIYTESTQSDFRSTQSLHRAISGLQSLHRVYTEQYRYTQSLHRMILGLWKLYLNPESLPVDPELVRLDFEQR